MINYDWTIGLAKAEQHVNAARSGDLASRIENIKAARRLLSLSQQAIQEEIKS